MATADNKQLRTGNALAGMFPKAKLEPKTVRTIMDLYNVSGYKTDAAGVRGIGYELQPALEAIICYFKDEADKRFKTGAEDRARKSKAEANIREKDDALQDRTLCYRADYKANFADAVAQGLAKISRLRSLTIKQKEEVLVALRTVKLPDLPDEGEGNEDTGQ